MSDPDLHAVIFSGGGADGAYQIGVAKALFNGRSRSTYLRPLDPAVFTGTSIGSFNASFLVSQWEDYGASAVANLEKIWIERMAWTGAVNGGFRVRLNPLELFDPRAYLREPLRFRPLMNFAADAGVLGWEALNRSYNLFASDDPLLERLTDFFNLASFVASEPWEKTIRESIDFKKIRESKRKLSIAATNWAFGEVREFRNGDMTDKLGPAAIRASVLTGCPDAMEIGDRAEAIRAGIALLRPGDVLVIAGKGHEPGQTIGHTVHPFDDATVARRMLFDLGEGEA